ncbi:phosphoglycolate phosphatase [Gracilibacillus boraciitolerans JCM 21714]|uniref:Phosphoglycolate phosphatase n=1 Tax=Gracilibacillus boraciitolerans JCM 21714 TaxID=1298598 RepID=W4VHU7_9BACI|nr:HAD-IA family hydrolase [Gracilibacillus boraciitolerans]GAE92787.1 phosphoglycolate phosphatase [Gracilibacillus boraciitolerans JCM 21714]
MVDTIIFDFDGTIVDSKKALVAGWNKLAQKTNYRELKLSDIEKFRKLSIKEKGQFLRCPLYKIPFLMPKFYRLYQEFIHEVEIIDGIKELMENLKTKGYYIGILSTNSPENISTVLERYQITSVSKIFSSTSVFGKDKLLKRLIMEERIPISKVIYIGDEERDIIACNKVNVPMIWVSWGDTTLKK